MSQRSGLPPLPATPSQRSGRSQPTPAAPGSVPPSDRGSVRSSQRGSVRSSQIGGSVRSSTRGVVGVPGTSDRGSARSITSSVALDKLQKLEDMLVYERRAREQAESTLLALQKERVARSTAESQQHRVQQELDQVMTQLRQVVAEPENTDNVRRLQALVRGDAAPAAPAGDVFSSAAPVRQARATRPVRELPPPTPDHPSFLDKIGQYDRERQRTKAQRGHN